MGGCALANVSASFGAALIDNVYLAHKTRAVLSVYWL